MHDITESLEQVLAGADAARALLHNCVCWVGETMTYGRESLLDAMRRCGISNAPTHYAVTDRHAALFAVSDEHPVAIVADHLNGYVTRLWYLSGKVVAAPIPARLDVPFDPSCNESATSGFDPAEHPSLSQQHVDRVQVMIRALDLPSLVKKGAPPGVTLQRLTPCLLRAFSDDAVTIVLLMVSALRADTPGVLQFPVAVRLTPQSDPCFVVDFACLANEAARSWTPLF